MRRNIFCGCNMIDGRAIGTFCHGYFQHIAVGRLSVFRPGFCTRRTLRRFQIGHRCYTATSETCWGLVFFLKWPIARLRSGHKCKRVQRAECQAKTLCPLLSHHSFSPSARCCSCDYATTNMNSLKGHMRRHPQEHQAVQLLEQYR